MIDPQTALNNLSLADKTALYNFLSKNPPNGTLFPGDANIAMNHFAAQIIPFGPGSASSPTQWHVGDAFSTIIAPLIGSLAAVVGVVFGVSTITQTVSKSVASLTPTYTPPPQTYPLKTSSYPPTFNPQPNTSKNGIVPLIVAGGLATII